MTVTASAARPAAAEAEAAVANGRRALENQEHDKLTRFFLLNIFQAVTEHVLVLQSELALFMAACGGNTAKTMRAFSASTGLVGLLGLVVNQLGGKLSDAKGRKPFFAAGPLANIMVALLVVKRGDSLSVLMATRVLKLILTTFSGTVITGAAIADSLNPERLMMISSQIRGWVGVAVMVVPFLEAMILKLGSGNPRNTYKMLGLLSVAHLLFISRISETLKQPKPFNFDQISETLKALNPVGFLQIYAGKNAALKHLVSITTLQYCSEGKCISELFQMWAKNDLKWGNDAIRNLLSCWGAIVTVGGLYLQPLLAKQFGAKAYTTLGNLTIWLALTTSGLVPHWTCAYGGLLPLGPGINGGSSAAAGALTTELAKAGGYGNAEFAAWTNNLRAIVTSLATIMYGQWYAFCKDRGLYPGSAWWLAGLTGGLLPQLLVWTSPAATFDKPKG